jgi:hypothetical protein
MSTFLQLDQDLSRNRASSSSKAALSADSNDADLVNRLKELVTPLEDEIDYDDVDSPGSVESVGEKRKL